MSIYAIGLNHTLAPLALREQFAYAPHQLESALHSLKQALNAEVALLSTCNRTELYVATAQTITTPQSQLAEIVAALAHSKQLAPAILSKHSYSLHSEAAVNHIYRVASGLDSMVLGETQILGQLKQATQHAQSAGTLGTSLQHVLQQSFSVAKAVRTQTQVGASSVSLAAAAVRLAQRIFGDIAKRKVLMIGAGEMIELCARHFLAHQPMQLTITNRSLDKAHALVDVLVANSSKQKHPHESSIVRANTSMDVIGLAQLSEVLGQYDIIVSCTASTLPMIGLGLVQRALAYKASKRLPKTTMMVDLAVPRDIEAEAGDLPDVYLYTVDDLGRVVQEGREARSAAVVQAEQIIAVKVQEFSRWQLSRRAVPMLKSLQQQALIIQQAELDKAMKAIDTGADSTQVLAQLSRQLAHKILHMSLHLTQQLALDTRVSDGLIQDLERGYLPRE
jgi:glutamyl-tRNA reductase